MSTLTKFYEVIGLYRPGSYAELFIWGAQIKVGGVRSRNRGWASGGCAPSGVQGQSPWSGGHGDLEAETLLAFEHLMDAANLLCFLKFGNLKNQILQLFFPKKKFNRPQFVTVYCELMKSNKSNMQK